MWLPNWSRVGGQLVESVLECPGCGVTGVIATATGGVCGVHVGEDQGRAAGKHKHLHTVAWGAIVFCHNTRKMAVKIKRRHWHCTTVLSNHSQVSWCDCHGYSSLVSQLASTHVGAAALIRSG